MEGLVENHKGLPHFEYPYHVTIKNVPPLAQWHAEFETVVNPVFIHFPNVVIDSAGPKARPGHARVDGQLARQHADSLAARPQNLVAGQERLELVEKALESGPDTGRLFRPALRQIAPAAAEAHVIAHHSGAAQRFEEVENLLALAKSVHQRRSQRAHVLQEKPRQAGVVEQARHLPNYDPDVFRPLRHRDARELLDAQHVGPIVGHRANVIQAVRVGDRTQVAVLLRDLFVVPMEVAEHRRQFDHCFPVQHDIHPEDSVR